MEFTFKTDQMRQRINGYFGYDAIAKIAFEPIYGLPEIPVSKSDPDPLAIAAIKETTKTIDNDELRAALEGFGEAMLAVSDSKTK